MIEDAVNYAPNNTAVSHTSSTKSLKDKIFDPGLWDLVLSVIDIVIDFFKPTADVPMPHKLTKVSTYLGKFAAAARKNVIHPLDVVSNLKYRLTMLNSSLNNDQLTNEQRAALQAQFDLVTNLLSDEVSASNKN